MKKLIVTVCNGNIHRSVIAAVCLQAEVRNRHLADQYDVVSRGLQGTCDTPPPRYPNLRLYPMEWPLTEPALNEFGIDIPDDQRATPITRDIAERAALILAMDRLVLSEKPNSLFNQFPDLRSKMRLFSEIAGLTDDIPDTGGVRDASRQRAVVASIHTLARSHFEGLLGLLKCSS